MIDKIDFNGNLIKREGESTTKDVKPLIDYYVNELRRTYENNKN